jgi:predicted DNA-binding transcriptional regulator AlpA
VLGTDNNRDKGQKMNLNIKNDLLKDQDVADLLQIHRNSVWRLLKINAIPKPIRVGQRSTRWLKTDIEAYIANQATKKTAP